MKSITFLADNYIFGVIIYKRSKKVYVLRYSEERKLWNIEFFFLHNKHILV